ncbi:OmpH family outer membrane protein [uncultured Flavobacterium sp.]|uniref:OmpH family outer membrane protein n=1 Tax=uncultured Flavobacterium sp. TaxID=165435 RepID=UPI0030C7E80C
MKKLLFIALGFAILSCNKQEGTTGLKTAYVDTEKLMKEHQQAIDIENKYKVKSQEMGRELDAEAKQFQADYESALRQAQAKGPQWAQQKAAELQEREQRLNIKQQSMYKEIQDASNGELDSLVKDIKLYIKDYGKKNGYDYVYGTGLSTPSILYAKDSYDITDELVKLLNDKYKPTEDTKTVEKEEVKK